MQDGGELALSHHTDLLLNDRVAYDNGGHRPALDNAEGHRIAACPGDGVRHTLAVSA